MEHDYNLYDIVSAKYLDGIRTLTNNDNIINVVVRRNNKADLFRLKMIVYAKLICNSKLKICVVTPFFYYYSKALKFARKNTKRINEALSDDKLNILDEIATSYGYNADELFSRIYEEYYE